jgi:hypothetical protein
MSEIRNEKGQFGKGHVNSEEMRLRNAENQTGNTYNNKLVKFPEECQKAYKDYCAWLSQGNSIEAWCYESDVMTLSYKTMEKYIREFPHDFPPHHKEIALTKSLRIWEERGLEMMIGKIDKCQPAIFQMFMRNKFSWDKDTNANKNSNVTLVEKLLDKLDNLDAADAQN